MLINLHGIHDVTFNSRRTEVTVQGGALISDVIAAGYASNALIETGNCNCVGTLGAILGGGFGYLMGIYGFGVDNIISLNVVTAKGNSITVTPKDVDLFWALRGTGPNFGIVTSAVMRSYPVAPDKKTAWYGPLTFKPDKIEALVQAINDLVLEPKMNIFLYYVTTGPPKYSPLIVAAPWYYGTEAEGRAAFASILELGPATDGTSILPYNHWNDGGDTFCVKGGRKPSYSAGLKHMVPHTWRAVWDQYVAFLQNNGTGSTSILLEAYSLFKARSVPDSSSSYPFRSTVNFNAIVIPWYEDPSLDTKAEAFGSKVRDLWRSTDGLPHDSTYVIQISRKPQLRNKLFFTDDLYSYVNFGFGDEYLSTVYGSNVHRLQALKQKYDPHGRFNQFFPLS